MKTEQQMSEIIQREKVLQRKKQIALVKSDIKHSNYYKTTGFPLPTKEQISYNTTLGKNYLLTKVVKLW